MILPKLLFGLHLRLIRQKLIQNAVDFGSERVSYQSFLHLFKGSVGVNGLKMAAGFGSERVLPQLSIPHRGLYGYTSINPYRKVSEISAALGNSATIIKSQNNYWGNSATPNPSKDTFHQMSATQ